MAGNTYWFHRNAFKFTNQIDFQAPELCNEGECAKLLADLKMSRMDLVQSYYDYGVNREALRQKYNRYVELLLGLISSPGDNETQQVTNADKLGPIGAKDGNKTLFDKLNDKVGVLKINSHKQCSVSLRHVFPFRWTDSLSIKPFQDPSLDRVDAANDLIGQSVNLGIALMKRASMCSAKESNNMDDAKEIHSCLKEASGVFEYAREILVGLLIQPVSNQATPYTDVDTRVLDCYCLQAKAETLEVTIARGIAMEHKESLIASLSNDTQIMYQEAYDLLKNTYEENKIELPLKWMKYFELKQKFYFAMSRAYWGLSLLEDQEKSGEAIAHLKQAVESLANTTKLGKAYVKAIGAGTVAKPHEHPFYQKIHTKVTQILTKCERENNMLYYQKVPEHPSPPVFKDMKKIADPVPFVLPEMCKIFTPRLYESFYATKKTKGGLLSSITMGRLGGGGAAAADVTKNYEKTPQQFRMYPVQVVKEQDLKIVKPSDCSVM